MTESFAIIKYLKPQHWLVLLGVAVIGVVGTFSIGQRLETRAVQHWIRQAESDVALATVFAQSWLAQSETIVSGLALGVNEATSLSGDNFENLVARSNEWNSEFALDAVALVDRIPRDRRAEAEKAAGRTFINAELPEGGVSDSFDHMVVMKSTDTTGLLRPMVDLLTKEAMAKVIKTAQRVPGQAFMGPAFSEDGRLYTLVAIGVADTSGSRILAGRVDLSEMIDVLRAQHVPKGINLRLSERYSDEEEETIERALFGRLAPPKDVVRTFTIRVTRGEARWSYHWDITQGYDGGAPTANVTMVQIGGMIITILILYSIVLLSIQNIVTQNTVERRTRELRDEIAEREQAQRALIRAKQEVEVANQSKSKFLTSMSHELRTPLNSILGFGQLLRTDPDRPPSRDQASALDQIIKAGKHLLELIQQILDLSRIEQGHLLAKIAPVDTKDVLRECVSLIFRQAQEKGLSFETDWQDAAHLPTVLADRLRLKQVLLNLLMNAVKYNTTGTRIGLNCHLARPGFLKFEVTDDGPGIPLDRHEEIFQPFNRIGAEAGVIEGTGIGLTIVRELVQMMDGEIQFESSPGNGARFWFELPIFEGTVGDIEMTEAATTDA